MQSAANTSIIKDRDGRAAHSLSPLGGEGWVEGLMTLKVPLTRIAEAILHSPVRGRYLPAKQLALKSFYAAALWAATI
jgi:hypothetical protein